MNNVKKKNNFVCDYIVLNGNNVVYIKGRNVFKKYKSDIEQENERQIDVKDCYRYKIEKNMVESMSLNMIIFIEKDIILYGFCYLDFCLVEVLFLFGLFLSFKYFLNYDGIIEEFFD